MNYKDHCNLCDNRTANLNEGILCGLTNKKPTFYKSCSKIILDKRLNREIESIESKTEKLLNEKRAIYKQHYLQIIFGLITICVVLYIINGLSISENDSIVYFSRKIRLVSVGCVLITTILTILAFSQTKLNKHKRRKKALEQERQKINQVLGNYN